MSAVVSPTTVPASPFGFGRVLRAGLVVAAVSAVVNVLVFLLARYVLGIPFVFPFAGEGMPAASLPVSMVLIASLVPAIAGALFLAVLGKVFRRPLRLFQIIGVVLLLLSLGGPFSLPVDLATKLALSLLHIVAAVVIIGGLTRLLGRAQAYP